MKKSFGSDNHAGIHASILESIARANEGPSVSYGDDPWTTRAIVKLQKEFGSEAQVFFVFNGTAANVLGLKAAAQSYDAILCSHVAHIYTDECGAPEFIVGSKLIPLKTSDGKLDLTMLESALQGRGDQHHVQIKGISLSQSTEYGTVYRPDKIRSISDFAHRNEMFVHMDGARLANAAASLGCGLRELTADLGVDVLSLGGTKNGLMFGEAVVIFDPNLAANFKYIRKQNMQLASKMRFISAQFEALFTDKLWLRNATHANAMAKLLASKVQEIPGITITQKVEANSIFAIVPKSAIEQLWKDYHFYLWNEKTHEVRWMTSFATTEKDVLQFVESIRKAVK